MYNKENLSHTMIVPGNQIPHQFLGTATKDARILILPWKLRTYKNVRTELPFCIERFFA